MSNPLLVARDVGKVFERGSSHPLEVLRKIDLDIQEGDSIAVIGKSGAGKSTLLHVLGTLEEPTSGTVHFQGQDIFSFDEESLSGFRNKKVGFVFQFHYLMLEFSALDNTMMPALLGGVPKKKARARAEALLEKVGLQERLEHKPGQLSGGEQQRVAIARALMMSPKLLLTDEMTGNLDPVTGQQVFELVQSIHSEFGMAMVSVTHDENLAASYSRIYRLTEGVLLPASLKSRA